MLGAREISLCGIAGRTSSVPWSSVTLIVVDAAPDRDEVNNAPNRSTAMARKHTKMFINAHPFHPKVFGAVAAGRFSDFWRRPVTVAGLCRSCTGLAHLNPVFACEHQVSHRKDVYICEDNYSRWGEDMQSYAACRYGPGGHTPAYRPSTLRRASSTGAMSADRRWRRRDQRGANGGQVVGHNRGIGKEIGAGGKGIAEQDGDAAWWSGPVRR